MSAGVHIVGLDEVSEQRHDAPPGSPLARLRQQAARQREQRTFDLAVGGAFGDQLVVRYGALPVSELERYAELGDKLTNLSLVIDAMVSSCRTVLYDGSDLEVTLDHRLWTLLGWELPPAIDAPDELLPREVIEALFGHNALALGEHVNRLVSWMQDADESPGEASGATS
jgi:hypothetical protein